MSYSEYPQDAKAFAFVLNLEELPEPFVKRCRVVAESDKAAEFTALIHATWELLQMGVDPAWLRTR